MRKRIIVIVSLFILLSTIVFYFNQPVEKETIKVGILHSLTGTMAISEKSVVDATLLAIEEINQKGGLLGRKIEPIVVDGKSDDNTFAYGAKKLIIDKKVSVIFGCWTSASRKTVKPILEKYNHLLFYPVQYEGLETSSNIIYLGAAPNQQIIPAVNWAIENLGKKFFLVGSDYVFPRTANEIMKDIIVKRGGEIAGEEYAVLGSIDFENIAKKIMLLKPKVILNTINGSSNIAFLAELYRFKINIPIINFSIAEDELRTFQIHLRKYYKIQNDKLEHAMSNRDINEIVSNIKKNLIVGNYAAWNYFQSIDSNVNNDFVASFKAKFGEHRVTDDPMEAAYIGVHIWAQTVETIQTVNVHKVRKAVKNQSFDAPEGMVTISSKNNHTWKTARIGKINADLGYDIIWSSVKPIRPVPFPISRSKSEWKELLKNLYQGWGKSWANSGK